MKTLLITIAFIVSMIGQVKADTEISYHTDIRGYNTFGVLTSGDVTKNTKFWGFTDFHGLQDSNSDRFDLVHYFMEYRLDYNLVQVPGSVNGLAVEAEYNDLPGVGNSLIRLGLVYSSISLSKRGWVQFRAHPWDTTENDDSQVSAAFGWLLRGAWSVSGWIDYNILENGKNQWVYEPALNYKVNDDLTASIEYRWNGYEDLFGLDGDGVAVGLVLKL